MSAEQLIALEAALGELGSLYVAAQRFTTLRTAAESDLLPTITWLGSALRARLRRGGLDDGSVDAAAREVIRLRTHWQAKLEALRESGAYRRVLAAWETGDTATLRRSLPDVLADVSPVVPSSALFIGVSAMNSRRRPGTRPFLTAEACAEKIAGYRNHGLPSEAGGDQWWERELTAVQVVDDPEALETPIALRLEPEAPCLPIFQASPAGFFHLYCRTLRAPFSVTLQAEVTDEWWAAYEESYPDYRTQLAQHLERLGVRVAR